MTIDAISQEIRDAIARNLPQQVGDALRERLAQADRALEQLDDAKTEIDRLVGEARVMAAQLQDAEAKLKGHKAIDVREAAVLERERAATINELNLKLQAAEDKTKFVTEVAMGLVRNTEFRQSVYECHNNRQVVVPSGGYVNNGNAETSTTSTSSTAA